MKKTIYSETNEIFIEWLQKKRSEKGLSLRDVGRLIDRHHSIIGNVENKVRRMDVAEFIHYCEELDLDPHEAISFILKRRALTKLNQAGSKKT